MKVENGVLLKVENNDIIDGKFEFPNGVTSIGYHAFSGCSSLSKIDIPDSVTSIGNGAFYCCSSLLKVDIPDSVTSIRNIQRMCYKYGKTRRKNARKAIKRRKNNWGNV